MPGLRKRDSKRKEHEITGKTVEKERINQMIKCDAGKLELQGKMTMLIAEAIVIVRRLAMNCVEDRRPKFPLGEAVTGIRTELEKMFVDAINQGVEEAITKVGCDSVD